MRLLGDTESNEGYEEGHEGGPHQEGMEAAPSKKAMKAMKKAYEYSVENCALTALNYMQVVAPLSPGLAYPIVAELRVIAKLAKKGKLRGTVRR